MKASVFSLGIRGIGIPFQKHEEIMFLRDILGRSGRQWKEETVEGGTGLSAFEKSVLLFSEDIKRREAETLSHTDIVLPFRELPQEHTRFPNLSFTTYAVEDDRADFTARGLAALPGGDAGREGMRFELLCLGLIGRVCVPGLSKKQVEPLLGAASCLLAAGLPLAEVLELINRRP